MLGQKHGSRIQRNFLVSMMLSQKHGSRIFFANRELEQYECSAARMKKPAHKSDGIGERF
jgi:hypothetical protein